MLYFCVTLYLETHIPHLLKDNTLYLETIGVDKCLIIAMFPLHWKKVFNMTRINSPFGVFMRGHFAAGFVTCVVLCPGVLNSPSLPSPTFSFVPLCTPKFLYLPLPFSTFTYLPLCSPTFVFPYVSLGSPNFPYIHLPSPTLPTITYPLLDLNGLILGFKLTKTNGLNLCHRKKWGLVIGCNSEFWFKRKRLIWRWLNQRDMSFLRESVNFLKKAHSDKRTYSDKWPYLDKGTFTWVRTVAPPRICYNKRCDKVWYKVWQGLVQGVSKSGKRYGVT